MEIKQQLLTQQYNGERYTNRYTNAIQNVALVWSED